MLELLNSHLQRELDHWLGQISPLDTSESSLPMFIRTGDVIRAHFLILDHFMTDGVGKGAGGVGPRNMDLLESAIGRQHTGFGGQVKYRDKFEIVATLFFGLIRNHPFHDANKRTALLTALLHLRRIGRTPDCRQLELEQVAVRTAERSLANYGPFAKHRNREEPEIAFLAAFFRRKTREIDRRHYFVTYRQLDGLLRRHGLWLDNAHGNCIDVVREISERSFFGKPKIKRVTICQIGFPGWKTQVSNSAVKTIRREASLDAEHGIDSQVFYMGLELAASLIAEFEAPLRRLADK